MVDRINFNLNTPNTKINSTQTQNKSDAYGVFGPVEKRVVYKKVAIKDFVKQIDAAKNEADVIAIFSKIDSGNIQQMFNKTTTDSGKHELIEKLYKKKISVKARNQILEKLLKAAGNNEKLQKSILSSAVYYSMNSNENNPQLLSKLSMYNAGTCLIQFQHEAYANKKQNRTTKELSPFTSWKSWRSAATYSQTMPQAIVNNTKMDVASKKSALINLLKSTVEIAKYQGMDSSKITRYYKAGLKTIQEYKYDDNTNTDKLNIILDELCCNEEKIYDKRVRDNILAKEGGI